MGIVVGIFDLFAYSVPGALYITIFAYVCQRVGWTDLSAFTTSPSALVLAGVVVASYLVGHATYGVGYIVDRLNPFYSNSFWGDAAATFAQRPGVKSSRPIIRMDPFLLQAAIEIKSREAATEIARLRAVGLMLRAAVVPALLGAAIAFIEVFTSQTKVFSGVAACVLLAIGYGCLRRETRLRGWAVAKTLELSYWLDDLDTQVEPEGP